MLWKIGNDMEWPSQDTMSSKISSEERVDPREAASMHILWILSSMREAHEETQETVISGCL